MTTKSKRLAVSSQGSSSSGPQLLTWRICPVDCEDGCCVVQTATTCLAPFVRGLHELRPVFYSGRCGSVLGREVIRLSQAYASPEFIPEDAGTRRANSEQGRF